MSIIHDLENFLTPLLASHGVELVDVQLTAESGRKILRVFIDKTGGIKLLDCEQMSDVVGAALDGSAIIPSRYVLEVSSPGLDRVLKKETDFVRFLGQKARITVQTAINGQRHFLGELKAAVDGTVTVHDVTNGVVTLALDNILRARLEPDL